MGRDEEITSIIIQRMIQRSNNLRSNAAANSDRDEERAVILNAVGANQICSEVSGSHTSQRINYEDKNFHCVFPWNRLSFSLTEYISPVEEVEKERSSIVSFPVHHATQKTSQNFKESITDYSPRSNESSLEDLNTEHKCSRTDSSITSPNGNTSVNKTGNTEFSDCFHCNAMLVHKDLRKWKKAISTQMDSPEKALVSVSSDKSTNTWGYDQDHLTSFVLRERDFITRDLQRSKVRPCKRFKSPLRSSSPELEVSVNTEFLVSQQERHEQEENGTSMESISTIPDKQTDCASLSETQEYKDLEAMVLHAAEVNERENMEENVTQLVEAATYNVDWFLRDALGDEMDISICTDSQDGQVIKPDFPEEYCSSNHGEPLFHTVSSYRMLTNLKRQKIRPHLSSVRMCIADAPTSPTEKQVQAAVQSLLSKADIHMSIIIQASKALVVCEQSKEFISSRERVECERILLISTHIRNAAYGEIHRLKFEDSEDTHICFGKGTIYISDLALKVKEDFHKSTLLDMEMRTWFVCLMSHNGRVLATEAEAYTKEGHIRFSGCYTFTELRKDFTIRVQVYCLKLRKQIPGCQSKPLSLMPMAVFGCPVTCKKAKNSWRKARPDLHERIKTSSFTPAGELHLRVHDVHCSKPWPLRKVPPSSPLVGTIDLELKTSLKLMAEYSGFLNLSEEFSLPGSWQRYWFYLKEHMLYYWNYPLDKDIKALPVGRYWSGNESVVQCFEQSY
ncbi:anillin-like isoform X2 [Schistocerca gregaria]|uniref:anillin-like isoform X2 n=1 Tax=Schistocerca gregaria TaxID=7010 RepID=UPI00211F0F28|nr:anillin-like isoform X2 [Schistocerca gregaria]